MTRAFTAVALLFAACELLSVYQLYFDQDATQFPDSLAPGAFEGWRISQIKMGMAPAHRQIEFFALWVANNKLIMTMLSLLCATSSESAVRVPAALIMTAGCLLYFPRLDPALRNMEKAGDVRANIGAEIGSLIGFILAPMWGVAFLAECHAMPAGRTKGKKS